MPGCILRAFGDDFAVEEFLRDSPFVPCRVFHRGEPRSLRRPEKLDRSGLILDVSHADDRLARQIEDALSFLRENEAELLRLIGWSGVDEVYLDFGCDLPYRKAPGRYYRLSIDLLRTCARLGIEIELSVYAIPGDEAAEEPG